MDEKIPFYRSGYRSLLACKVKNFSTLPGLYMLREHEIFFLESRPVGRGCDGFVRTPPPTGCGGPFYTSPDTSRQKTKINSWIQFFPGQPHFLAHSSNFILRHYIHLTVRFVKM